MSTGYTEILLKDEPALFKDYVWHCARGMGALIMMRDSPYDAPIRPTESSNYYRDGRARAIDKKEEYFKRTDEEWALEYHQHLLDLKEDWQRQFDSYRRDKKRYDDMLLMVDDWDPPTEDHEGLKKFMISQIGVSREYDREPDPCAVPTFSEYKESEAKSVEWDLEYNIKYLKEDLDRNAERSQWVQALVDSVGEPPQGRIK